MYFILLGQPFNPEIFMEAWMKSEILNKVKGAILKIEPSAKMILYGSRARDDFHENSDWDFLILVDGVVDDKRTDKIRHQLYEIEWETGDVLCSIVRSRAEWESPEYNVIPLYKNIKMEGIPI
jgi:uncharacterized protein